MTSLGAIVERRTDRLVNPLVSGCRPFWLHGRGSSRV